MSGGILADSQPAQHDIRAEQAVLGAVLHNPSVLSTLAGLKGDHFYRPRHALLFKTLQQMYSDGEDIDSMTVWARLRKGRESQRDEWAPYLSDCLQAFKSSENVSTYAAIVIDHWKLRQFKALGDRFHQLHDQTNVDDIPDALEAARRFLDEVEVDSGGDDFDSAYQVWSQWYETDVVAIPTPWYGLNRILLGGLHRGRLYTLAGRPGAGKSAAGLNAALQAARAGYRSVFYSLEMPQEECMSRLLAAGADVPLKNIFGHQLDDEERRRVEVFATNGTRPNLDIDDSPSRTIESIVVDARLRKRRSGLDLIVVDHSLLVGPSNKNQSEIQHINHVSRMSKLLARQLDCVVVLIHQLNRDLENGERKRKPRMRDLHGGGEKDPDAVIILDRDEGKILAHVVKNRMGPQGTVAELKDELAYGRLG